LGVVAVSTPRSTRQGRGQSALPHPALPSPGPLLPGLLLNLLPAGPLQVLQQPAQVRLGLAVAVGGGRAELLLGLVQAAAGVQQSPVEPLGARDAPAGRVAIPPLGLIQ